MSLWTSRLPDEHLPRIVDETWTCRSCPTAWPCKPARRHLNEGSCQCGAATWWDLGSVRSWHVGPRCYTETDRMNGLAHELKQIHAANPHFPPSHRYPPKPRRPIRQRPPYAHTPTAAGDVAAGTWLWVKPGGLHPGWGDLHHLAMLTRPGTPRCEVWLYLDGTVHDVPADRLNLDLTQRRAGIDVHPGKPLPGEHRWLRWTVQQHLDHRRPAPPTPAPTTQDALFTT